MAILTLAQAKERFNDEISRAIVDTVITVNPMYSVLPWTPFAGQSLTVNPVDVYGNVEAIEVGDAITADAPSTYDQVTFFPTTIVGNVEMNGLVQVTSVGAGIDELSAQVQLKSREVGREYQRQMAVGSGVAPQLHSLRSLSSVGQSLDGAGAGISFDLLDELKDKVRSKGTVCDAFIAPESVVRQIRSLMRAAGGNTKMELNGRTVDQFEGIPVLINDYLSVKETAAGVEDAMGALTSIYAINFDDGTKTTGVSAIYPQAAPNMGFALESVGKATAYDQETYRVKLYAGFANFSNLGLARLYNVLPKVV